MPVQTLTGQVVLTLNPAKMNELLKGPTGPVVRDLFVRGEKVRQRAITECPVGKGPTAGNLRDHHVKRLATENGNPVMLVGVTSVPYALFVHEGTQPHDIYPRNARVLAFIGSDGTQVFARVVHHPGNRPQRWLVRSLPAAK